MHWPPKHMRGRLQQLAPHTSAGLQQPAPAEGKQQRLAEYWVVPAGQAPARESEARQVSSVTGGARRGAAAGRCLKAAAAASRRRLQRCSAARAARPQQAAGAGALRCAGAQLATHLARPRRWRSAARPPAPVPGPGRGPARRVYGSAGASWRQLLAGGCGLAASLVVARCSPPRAPCAALRP